MGGGTYLKVIFFEELTQEVLNALIEKGEVFIAIHKDSILSEQTIISESDSIWSDGSISRERYL